DLRLERLPEAREQRYPVLFAAADRIQLVFEPGGEIVVDIAGEMPGQEAADRAPDIGRLEAAAVEDHVFAVEQHLDDAGIGRRAADAVFLQRLDQAGFGEARRRFGEVLVGDDVAQRYRLADFHERQLARLVLVLGGLLVAALLVDGKEARVDDRGAGGTERG